MACILLQSKMSKSHLNKELKKDAYSYFLLGKKVSYTSQALNRRLFLNIFYHPSGYSEVL